MVEASSASVLDRIPHQTTSKELERDLQRGRPEGLGSFPASSCAERVRGSGLVLRGRGRTGEGPLVSAPLGGWASQPWPFGEVVSPRLPRVPPRFAARCHSCGLCGVRTLGCWVLVGVGGPVGRPWESLGGRSSLPHRCCAAKTGLASWQDSAALGQASFCVPALLASAGLATLSSSPQPTWGGGRALGSLRPEPQ